MSDHKAIVADLAAILARTYLRLDQNRGNLAISGAKQLKERLDLRREPGTVVSRRERREQEHAR